MRKNMANISNNNMMHNSATSIPKGKHFAIIKTDIIFEHDSYSNNHDRTPITRYYSFTDEHEWKAEITRLAQRKDEEFCAMVVSPAVITSTVNVSISV